MGIAPRIVHHRDIDAIKVERNNRHYWLVVYRFRGLTNKVGKTRLKNRRDIEPHRDEVLRRCKTIRAIATRRALYADKEIAGE